jgi:hypothetical protein
MKNLLIILVILFQVNILFSQINMKDITLEVRNPIPIGDNILTNNLGGYKGIIDIGIGCNLININNITIGMLMNSSMLKFHFNDVNLIVLSPKIKIDYRIDFKKISIIPNVAIGYSNWRFSTSFTAFSETGIPYEYKFKQVDDGLTIRGATKLAINSKKRINWFIELAYEFTRLEKSDYGALDNKYNRNFHVFYPGIGVIWNFNKE